MKFIACYENTPAGTAALRLAIQHAAVWGAEVEVASAIVRDEPIKYARLKEKEEDLEKEVRPFFIDTAIKFDTHLLVDDMEAGEQILHFAKRKKADMIFLGVKRKSRVSKRRFGSNARYMVLNADCPVVTVHPPKTK